MRTNHEDFLDSGPSFQRAWIILQKLGVPPSIEVFEFGYIDANRKTPHLSPPSYALHLSWKYKRAATPTSSQGCMHQSRVSREGATVCPICDGLQWMPLA